MKLSAFGFFIFYFFGFPSEFTYPFVIIVSVYGSFSLVFLLFVIRHDALPSIYAWFFCAFGSCLIMRRERWRGIRPVRVILVLVVFVTKYRVESKGEDRGCEDRIVSSCNAISNQDNASKRTLLMRNSNDPTNLSIAFFCMLSLLSKPAY